VLDRVVSSYTPTAQLLNESRTRSTNRRTDRAPGTGARVSLVVGINHTPGLPPLTLAEAEAQQVQHLLEATTTPLLGKQATHHHVTTALPTTRIAHFACHALADETDPSRSHLALHDEPLPVAELSQMNLPHAQLAYLSACTTATGSVRLLDESIHIASAFQLAGYPHVIATLWPINDFLAPELATDIHTALAHGTPPHVAVHHAVRDLRNRPAFRSHPEFWASHVHFGP
jgi:CHAT domain-containing protein